MKVQKWLKSHKIQKKFEGIRVIQKAKGRKGKVNWGGMAANSFEFNPCGSHAFATFGRKCYERLEKAFKRDKDQQKTYNVNIELAKMKDIGKRVWEDSSFHDECKKHIRHLANSLKKIRKATGGRIRNS